MYASSGKQFCPGLLGKFLPKFFILVPSGSKSRFRIDDAFQQNLERQNADHCVSNRKVAARTGKNIGVVNQFFCVTDHPMNPILMDVTRYSHVRTESPYTNLDCSTAAAMKLAKSGWGSKGRDFSSG